jgi:hypothetical protein
MLMDHVLLLMLATLEIGFVLFAKRQQDGAQRHGGRRPFERRILASGLLAGFALSAGCSSNPSGPTAIPMITSIRYQRVYSATTPSTSPVTISVSIPSQKHIPFCFAQVQDADVFVCPTQNLMFTFDEEMSVWAHDSAVGHWAGKRIWVNGQEVTRVDPNGGYELARFRISSSGQVY